MKILITGADGMLGSNLVRLLLERKHEVSVFLHPSSKSTTLEGLEIKKYIGDILKPESIELAMGDYDAVIHAAALTNIWPNRSEIVRRVNIEGTRNMINAVLNHRIKRFIYVGSGSSVNAQATSNSKYAFPGAKFGLDYIDSKFEALNLVLDAVKTKGLPAIAVLPTFMIGPYDSLPGSGKMILTLAQGKLKFYTGGGRNFIYVKDVAVAIANSLEMGQIGKYYIAGNENLTYQSFFKKVALVVNKPAPTIQIPGWIAKTVGLLGSTYGDIFKKEPLITYPIARISCENQFVESHDAVRELKMPKTSIEIAVKDCYTWFQENGYC